MQAVEDLQRILHLVVKVFTNKVVERFDAIFENSNVVDGSERVQEFLITFIKINLNQNYFLAVFLLAGKKCSGM